MVTLSVRSAFELYLSALQLPAGSEVLFLPGITIPSMVQLVERHGLQPVGVDPTSPTQLLPSSLKGLTNEHTRLVVVSHLFGQISRATELIEEAKELGILVLEDGPIRNYL